MTQDATGIYLGRAFALALILSNDAQDAESLVAMGIGALPDEHFSEAALLAEVATTAWNGSAGEAAPDVAAGCGQRIPQELRAVAGLPKRQRFCFSMRVLAGMTATACAQLTGMSTEQVCLFVQMAMQALAKTPRSREREVSLAVQ
jgi:hypothetical protein